MRKLGNKAEITFNQKRNYYFDILKIFSIMAVVLIHSSSKSVENATEFSNPDFFFAVLYNAVSRFGVPVFAMVSGALMLSESKTIETKDIYKKYVKNIVLVFLFWSALYTYVFKWNIPVSKGQEVKFEKLILYFFEGHYHMWYLYMLIGLYIATPILRQFVKKDNVKSVKYFLTVGFIVQGIVPFVLQLHKDLFEVDLYGVYNDLSFNTFLGYSFYYVLGWYLHNVELTKKQRQTLYILGVAGLIFTVIFTYLMSNDMGKTYMLAYRNFFFNNVLFSSAVFVFIKSKFSKVQFSEKKAKVLSTLSSLTFGVFIIHPFFIEVFRTELPENMAESFKILMFWLIVLTITFALCFVISKIPVLKKLIRS